MHHAELPPPTSATDDGTPWYRLLNRYHWFVFIVAALGWLFDTMDQQLFNLGRVPAMRELLSSEGLSPQEFNAKVAEYAGYSTSIFLIGWATGGIGFGILGDRIGRVKTMLLTILVYSIFTGLSAMSTGFWDFSLWRFLTGLGVGGEFAVGVSLVAEVMPERARPFALGALQALSAVGNITAALIAMTGLNWRWMFAIGTAPALLSILVRRRLKEPERWQAVSATEGVQKQLGSYSELFGDPRWRRHALIGLMLASAGVIGLWGIGFFSIDLIRSVFRANFEAEGFSGPALDSKLSFWSGITSLVLNAGAFFGIYSFSYVSHYLGRRPTFAISFLLAMFSTAVVFWYLGRVTGFYDVFWMIPIMGFCQLALFGGYAIYFPELFPTRLRSTGTSFCYNVGRFVAALGPFTLGLLTSRVFTGLEHEPMRYAGVTMCGIFLVGLLALPFAPETRGKPLPE
jgi:MFS family permease